MAGLTKSHGWYSIAFRYRGLRLTEPLHTQNREEAERGRRRYEKAVREGTFDYLNWWPNSRHLARLGLEPESVKSSLTLGIYAQMWLEKKQTLKPGTLAWYGDTLKNYIRPSEIAKMPLAAITKSDLELFVAKIATKKKNGEIEHPRAVNAAIARLKSIFADARDDNLIDKNPMERIAAVGEPRTKIDPFTLEEIARILDAADELERAIITVLFFTGMRPNEALALKWDDVDWGRGRISVARTGGRYGVHLPKTAGSERDVVMLDVVRGALQQQRSRSQLRSREGWVFPSDQDTPLLLANFRERNWRPLLRRAGVKFRNIYQCRHTFATLMLSYESVQWVASQLGHASISMVVDHYAKWTKAPAMRSEDRANADIFAAVGGAAERPAQRAVKS